MDDRPDKVQKVEVKMDDSTRSKCTILGDRLTDREPQIIK